MRNKYTNEQLENAIKCSTTWADVCRILGVKPMTGSQTHIKKRAIDFNISFTHFVGSAFNKGRTFNKKNALEYCYNGSNVSSHKLKLKLIRDGYKKHKCEKCGNDTWLGQEIPIELHHIDGNHFNNEFNNLIIVCSNCHSILEKEMRV
jgi:Zn finger protein HypA/HybF involved in hydrogenase expression